MKIKQAMILAAGKGTRMRPLTLSKPKPLVDVAGKPLIVWHIERLAAAGIERIVLNAGYLSDVLIAGLQALDLPTRLGIELLISVEEAEPLETAGGIKYALAQGLLLQEPFILINGDVWTQFDFRQLLSISLTDDVLAFLVMTKNPDHNPSGDFILNEGRLYEKREHEPALTFSGISVISPRLLDGVTAGERAALAPLLKNQMQKNGVRGIKMQDKWVDVGTLQRLAEVEDYIRQH